MSIHLNPYVLRQIRVKLKLIYTLNYLNTYGLKVNTSIQIRSKYSRDIHSESITPFLTIGQRPLARCQFGNLNHFKIPSFFSVRNTFRYLLNKIFSYIRGFPLCICLLFLPNQPQRGRDGSKLHCEHKYYRLQHRTAQCTVQESSQHTDDSDLIFDCCRDGFDLYTVAGTPI